jgi:hypothetical protein
MTRWRRRRGSYGLTAKLTEMFRSVLSAHNRLRRLRYSHKKTAPRLGSFGAV